MANRKRRKDFVGSLQECLVKLAVMTFTISIGLWCGWNDSYGAFYIAVLMQAVNNMYDAASYFKGYSRFITIFQVIAFVAALVALILSVIHFTAGGKLVDNKNMMLVIIVGLSIPVLHYSMEVYNIIRKEQY